MIKKWLLSKNRAQLQYLLAFIVVLFWTFWFTIVSASDFTELLKVEKILPPSFPFVSGNFALIIKSLSQYRVHYEIPALAIYTLVLFAAIVTSIFFWIAVFNYKKNKTTYLRFSYIAFIFSIGMTCFFILADEIFIQYEFGHNHVVRLGFQMISLVIFYLFTEQPSRMR